jgi:hypothetical protein
LHAKECPRCGGRFGCAQGEPGCWCETIVLSRETLAALRTLADDCLCPTCLEALAAADRRQDEPAAMQTTSLCASCVSMREVRGRCGQTYLLCRNPAIAAKYPRQPVLACAEYRASEAQRAVDPGQAGS